MMQLRVVSMLVAAAFAAQASTDQWANLNQVAPGTEIRVALSSGKTFRGFLQTVTTDSLAINATTSQENLPRTEIKRVQVKRPGHRGRNTLIGFGIGAGAGLAVGAGTDQANHSGWFSNAGKAIFTPLGAIVGTVVGVALPTGGWHEVYRAP